eukprot:gene9053-12211_t
MIEFDFEKDVQKLLPKLCDDLMPTDNQYGGFKLGDQKHRIIVCRHYLLGLCHNGADCTYLHRLDKSKMPACKHGKLCKIKNCPLKHVAEEEIEECIFFKQGFCYNGPKCGRRHIKRMPEDCPEESLFETMAANSAAQAGKKAKTNQPNDNYKVTLCTHWLLSGTCHFNEECHYAHGEDEINEGYQPNREFLNDQGIYDPTALKLDTKLEMPFPTSAKCSYFLLQSPDLRALAIARRRGVWSVSSRMAAELNAAFRASDHVIFYFSVRALRGIYGVAKMAGNIVGINMIQPMTSEFPILWLRSIRIALKTVAQLKLGNTGMFVGRCSVDGRFENKVGLDMLLTAYRKPEWYWQNEIPLAEQGLRIVDTGAATTTNNNTNIPNNNSIGEYFPTNGQSSYYLPPDVLFAPEWVERASNTSDKIGFINKFSSNNSTGNAIIAEFYSGDFPGFVFCATSQIVEEMFSRFLIGLPMEMTGTIIHPSVPLFILDTQTQVMFGIFHSDGELKYNIEPTAFCGWTYEGSVPKSTGVTMLPLQMKFKIALESPPIPMMDPEIKAALGNSSGMGPIGVVETRNLANLFARRASAKNQTMNPNNNSNNNQVNKKNYKSNNPMAQEGANNPYYKPPFKFIRIVPIDIQGSTFEIKRRLLGTNASTIIGIVEEIGSKYNIRIRMRGLGSGFHEGPGGLELQEPLHFNASAETEELLEQVCQRLKVLIDTARIDIPPNVF